MFSKYYKYIILAAIVILTLVLIIIGLSKENDKAVFSPMSDSDVLQINEIMSANKDFLFDENGDYNDWIEIYNPSDYAVSLNNYTLTDDETDYTKWVFPNITIQPKSYMIVFCSDLAISDKDVLYQHTNFKLNSSGDLLVLTNPNGQIVDYVVFDKINKNQSYGRELGFNDEWTIYTEPTPGFPNDKKGYLDFLDTMKATDSPLIVTEIMSSNKTIIKDDNGNSSDWIEIYNRGAKAISLKGYKLSDDEKNPSKWAFPDIDIQSGEYIIIYCTGVSINYDSITTGDITADFKLSADKAEVILQDPVGRLIDNIKAAEIGEDKSFARLLSAGKYSNEFINSDMPTPGYENSKTAYDIYQESLKFVLGDIIINEVLSSNTEYAEEVDKNNYDFIEIHNRGSSNINLSGYGLSTNNEKIVEWIFPDAEIEAGGYIVILASGIDNEPLYDLYEQELVKKYIHTDFKLSIDGEKLILFDAEGDLIDTCEIGYMRKNISYGRMADEDKFFYFTKPTPGSENSDGIDGLSLNPKFLNTPGNYKTDDSITVEIIAGKGESIYYTTDCSTPTSKSMLYDGDIDIRKTTVIRAVSIKEGYLKSEVVSGTFFINDFHELPVVSLITDDKYLWSNKQGIYSLYGAVKFNSSGIRRANAFQNWVVPAYFELIIDGTVVFGQNVGIGISGDYSRREPQKGISINAKNIYGENYMDYPFFDDLPYESYKSLVLRAAGNDNRFSKMRDAMMTSVSGDGSLVDVSHYRLCVLYLNGEFFGIYYIREKMNEHYAAQRLGIDADKIDILKANRTVTSGSDKEYNKFINYLMTHSLKSTENYKYVSTQMDVFNFMDYIIAEIYWGNTDSGNIRYYKEKGSNGKWRWILYDFDWAWFSSTYNWDSFRNRLNPEGHGTGNYFDNEIVNSLMENKEWKNAFIKRFAELMKTTYSTKKVIARIDEIAAAMAPEKAREAKVMKSFVKQHYPSNYPSRSYMSSGFSVSSWEKQVNYLRKCARSRPAMMKSYLKRYFRISNSEMKKLFG